MRKMLISNKNKEVFILDKESSLLEGGATVLVESHIQSKFDSKTNLTSKSVPNFSNICEFDEVIEIQSSVQLEFLTEKISEVVGLPFGYDPENCFDYIVMAANKGTISRYSITSYTRGYVSGFTRGQTFNTSDFSSEPLGDPRLKMIREDHEVFTGYADLRKDLFTPIQILSYSKFFGDAIVEYFNLKGPLKKESVMFATLDGVIRGHKNFEDSLIKDTDLKEILVTKEVRYGIDISDPKVLEAIQKRSSKDSFTIVHNGKKYSSNLLLDDGIIEVEDGFIFDLQKGPLERTWGANDFSPDYYNRKIQSSVLNHSTISGAIKFFYSELKEGRIFGKEKEVKGSTEAKFLYRSFSRLLSSTRSSSDLEFGSMDSIAKLTENFKTIEKMIGQNSMLNNIYKVAISAEDMVDNYGFFSKKPIGKIVESGKLVLFSPIDYSIESYVGYPNPAGFINLQVIYSEDPEVLIGTKFEASLAFLEEVSLDSPEFSSHVSSLVSKKKKYLGEFENYFLLRPNSIYSEDTETSRDFSIIFKFDDQSGIHDVKILKEERYAIDINRLSEDGKKILVVSILNLLSEDNSKIRFFNNKEDGHHFPFVILRNGSSLREGGAIVSRRAYFNTGESRSYIELLDGSLLKLSRGDSYYSEFIDSESSRPLLNISSDLGSESRSKINAVIDAIEEKSGKRSILTDQSFEEAKVLYSFDHLLPSSK